LQGEVALDYVRDVIEYLEEFHAIYTNRNGYQRRAYINEPELIELLQLTKTEDDYISRISFQNHSWTGELVVEIFVYDEGESTIPFKAVILEEKSKAEPLYQLDWDNPKIYAIFSDEHFGYWESTTHGRTPRNAVVSPETIEQIVMVEFVPKEARISTAEREHYVIEIHLMNGLKLRGTVGMAYYGNARDVGYRRWRFNYNEFMPIKP
jgi:hypothetical protein